MIRAIMLVPLRDNDGHEFHERRWRDLERRLVSAFGGFSVPLSRDEARVFLASVRRAATEVAPRRRQRAAAKKPAQG